MVADLEPLAKAKGCTLAQLALAWCVQQPGVTSPIIGPRTMAQLEDNLGALAVTITAEDRAAIDAPGSAGRHGLAVLRGRLRSSSVPLVGVSVDQQALRTLLQRVADGDQNVDTALAALRSLPYEELGFATLDHHRQLRWGFPETIYCEGKTPAQVAGIAARLAEHCPRLLGTRASLEHFAAAQAQAA